MNVAEVVRDGSGGTGRSTLHVLGLRVLQLRRYTEMRGAAYRHAAYDVQDGEQVEQAPRLRDSRVKFETTIGHVCHYTNPPLSI